MSCAMLYFMCHLATTSPPELKQSFEKNKKVNFSMTFHQKRFAKILSPLSYIDPEVQDKIKQRSMKFRNRTGDLFHRNFKSEDRSNTDGTHMTRMDTSGTNKLIDAFSPIKRRDLEFKSK